MSKTVVVVGSQWGDEGKGKITHFLSESSDCVVRYQGGDNAGHTIVFNNHTYKLQLIPSGVFHSKCLSILGNGMVINPKQFLKEVAMLQSAGFDCSNLWISDRAHVLFDYHIELDAIKEAMLGDLKIGTTKKGIGPAYTDKIAREGIRMIDFVSEDFLPLFTQKLHQKNSLISYLGGTPLDVESEVMEYQLLAKTIKPYVQDTISMIHSLMKQDKKVLFEGAQGALLDVDFGSYPYVTSSNPSGGGVSIGTGVGPTKIDQVIGIVKAYSTRVGEGAFPTEFENETAVYIRETAHEYGTVTRRPRRIGWLDTVLLNYSVMINGFTGLSIMLLDVLSTIPVLKICTGYQKHGQTLSTIPARNKDFEACLPIYEELPGWKEDITKVKSFEELPIQAQQYLERIEELTGVPVVIFSVGPDQKQTVVRKHPFNS